MLTQDRIHEEPSGYTGEPEIWRGWVQKGKRRTNSGERQRNRMAGIVGIVLAMGSVFYLLAVR